MHPPRYLTKSRFKMAVECPTKLYYTGKPKQYKDAMSENDFLRMLAEGGYQVGELAKCCYPEGIEIEGLGHEAAEQKTLELLKRDKVILFEPAIRFGNMFVRIDILVKDGNHFDLIEVKAKSFDSTKPDIAGARIPIKSGWLPYIQDAAFQTWVLKQAVPGASIRTLLMMPDKSKVAQIDGINQLFKIRSEGRKFIVEHRYADNQDIKAIGESLLERVCIDGFVAEVLTNPIEFPGGKRMLADVADEWASAYASDHKIQPTIGAHCAKCQFKANADDQLASGFIECWTQSTSLSAEQLAKETVLDIWNYRGKQSLIEHGCYQLSGVHREDIGDFDDEIGTEGLSNKQRQWLQVNGLPKEYAAQGFYLDEVLVQSEMAGWPYPWHFIDFETSSVAMPFYASMRPYEPVAFQFSHHIMESDGSVRHAGQFLDTTPGHFPNFDFARELKVRLDKDEGAVFMWSHHENTILSKIIEQLNATPSPPDDKEALQAFLGSLTKGGRRAMVDLKVLASKAYFHPDTKGGNSIKQVLPAVLKSSPKLKNHYSQAVYGTAAGMPSLNFAEMGGVAWLDEQQGILNPYETLKGIAEHIMPDVEDAEDGVIAEGGAATTAYSRLQFEDIDPEARASINESLLRYCELDTLAMVIVVQGWQESLG